MTIENMKEVLVEVGSSKNIVKFQSSFLASDRQSIRQKLIVLAQSNPYLKAHISTDKLFILQRYNPEYRCFVDLTDKDGVGNKEHIKVVLTDEVKDEREKNGADYSVGMKRPFSGDDGPAPQRHFNARPNMNEQEDFYGEAAGERWYQGDSMPSFQDREFGGYNDFGGAMETGWGMPGGSRDGPGGFPGRGGSGGSRGRGGSGGFPGRGGPGGFPGRGRAGSFSGRGGSWGSSGMMGSRDPMNSWVPPPFYGSGDDGWYEGDYGPYNPYSEGSGFRKPWVAQMEAEETAELKREPAQVKKIYAAAYLIQDRQPVQVLNEYCLKKWGGKKPVYEIVSEESENRKPDYRFKVIVNGKTFESDRSSSLKKQAKVYAAIKALYVLKLLF